MTEFEGGYSWSVRDSSETTQGAKKQAHINKHDTYTQETEKWGALPWFCCCSSTSQPHTLRKVELGWGTVNENKGHSRIIDPHSLTHSRTHWSCQDESCTKQQQLQRMKRKEEKENPNTRACTRTQRKETKKEKKKSFTKESKKTRR